MIEIIVLNHLSAALDVPVGLEIPPSPAGRFVVLQKTGGGCIDHIAKAVFAVQSYGDTLLEAAQLNKQVKAAMAQLDTLPEVSRCSLNTDYNFTDTAHKRYRYQAVFEITHY